MMIKEYHVVVKWSQKAVMSFIAKVPPEYYWLNLLNNGTAIGIIIGTETMEFLTNEIVPESITFIEASKRGQLPAYVGRTIGSASQN